MRLSRFSNTDTAGFSPTGTLQATQGNAYASYMLGAVNSATITDNNVVWAGHRYRDYSFYVQDDWKLTSKVSVNLGLRWDIYRPYREQYDRFSYLDPESPEPRGGGAVRRAGIWRRQRRRCVSLPDDHQHPLPELPAAIGVAYAVNSKTVMRDEFQPGVYTRLGRRGREWRDRSGTHRLQSPGVVFQRGHRAAGVLLGPGCAGVAPPAYLTRGFGVGFTTDNSDRRAGPTTWIRSSPAKPPYYMNWASDFSANCRAAMTLGATYSASVGHFLPRNGDIGIWTNSMLPQYLVLGALLGAQATAANIAAAQAIVPGDRPAVRQLPGHNLADAAALPAVQRR